MIQDFCSRWVAMICVVVALFGLSIPSAEAVTIDWVTIGNPSNIADTHGDGYGAVHDTYNIAKHEVTNAQYVEFLNAVAKSDPHGLYHTLMDSNTVGGIIRNGSDGSYVYSVKDDAIGEGPNGSDYSYANKPVVYVNFWDAARFTNWLHNGQVAGDTEMGAYNLGGVSEPVNGSVSRNSGAKYFLPSEDEWYKAAYYDPGTSGYFDYATGSDSPPDNNLPSGDSGNSANFVDGSTTTGNLDYPLTDVGAYASSGSPYGTFDQNGNVSEWNETIVNTTMRGIRGGSWQEGAGFLPASHDISSTPSGESPNLGFRVAGLFSENAIVPEPSSLALALLALASTAWLALKRKSPA